MIGDDNSDQSELRQRGLLIGVVSDRTHELVAAWRQLPVAAFVDATAFSIEVGAGKPDPRICLAATDALAVAPSECLYVGDGASQELTGAQAIGMTAVWLDADDAAEHVSYRREEDWVGLTAQRPPRKSVAVRVPAGRTVARHADGRTNQGITPRRRRHRLCVTPGVGCGPPPPV